VENLRSTGTQVMAHLLGTRAVACLTVVVEFDTNLNASDHIPSLVREAVMHELGGDIKAVAWYESGEEAAVEGTRMYEDAQCIFYI